MTAEDIHAAIVPQQPYLDIATVYRTLQWLQSVDLVASIDLGDGKLRYEYRPRGEYHHHLVCQHCGTHIQIPDTYLASLKHEIEHEYGFLLDANHLALPGSCAVCAAGNAITKNRTR
jgi:Fur family ferric uptake transcriptional regulator